MKVEYNHNEYAHYIKEKMSNGQTFYMELGAYDWTEDSIYINIYVTVYNKRKHKDKILNDKTITGTSPFESAFLAMKAFPELESAAFAKWFRAGYDNVIITTTWVDNRRRDVYAKYLTKRGYQFGIIEGEKCLYKKLTKEEYFNHELSQ